MLAALAAVMGLTLTLPPGTQAADQKKFRVLFVTQSAGFRHGSVTRKDGQLAVAEQVMTKMGQDTGLFDVDCTQDVAKDFTKENLQKYDIVMFYTTGNLPIAKDDLDYFFKEFMNTPNKGFLGTHSAADTFKDYQPYWDMIGGTFNGHPWGSGSTVTVTVQDKSHPAMKPWGDEFTIQDEIYQFKNWQPEKVHVLASLNMAKVNPKKPYLVPIAWCKEYQKSKVFHMSMGHREDMWTNPKYQESLMGAMKWIVGWESADATPNPELSAKLDAQAKKDAGQ
ncbi:MAG: ThuA domain-containing protein [Phycisphaera sp.]|nr:ThuA domain-containing protein [Phycisphaera sp.]